MSKVSELIHVEVNQHCESQEIPATVVALSSIDLVDILSYNACPTPIRMPKGVAAIQDSNSWSSDSVVPDYSYVLGSADQVAVRESEKGWS